MGGRPKLFRLLDTLSERLQSKKGTNRYGCGTKLHKIDLQIAWNIIQKKYLIFTLPLTTMFFSQILTRFKIITGSIFIHANMYLCCVNEHAEMQKYANIILRSSKLINSNFVLRF